MLNTENRSSRIAPTNRIGSRAGLTTIEYIGCAIAIAGGVWLGAMYVGIDLQQAAHTALTETDLLEKVPPEWRPVGPEEGETAEQKAARLQSEFDALGDEISSLHANTNNSEGTPASRPDTPSSVDPVARDQTLAYWRAINQIALDEATMQRDAEAAFDPTNAAQVFAVKAHASQLASEAIGVVSITPKVDKGIVKFARQLADWYENGAELSDRAVQIWESPASTKGRAQLNEDWNRAELQHRNEARLISEKAATLANSLSRRYGVEFPEFAKQPDTRMPAADDRSTH